MPTREYDLRYLRASIPLIEHYLMSSEIYWPIGAAPPDAETPYPSMTLGGIALAEKRLHASTLSPAQSTELAALDEELSKVRSHWRVAWGHKAADEFRARLSLWRDFLEEYRQNAEANSDRYTYEVSRRVLLQLLDEEAENIPAHEKALLHGLDELLRAYFVPGSFIWEPHLAAAFPPEDYWYLYGKVRSR